MKVIRYVDELDAKDRQSLEHVLGHSLNDNQQLVIYIVDLDVAVAPMPVSKTLPHWCNVYEGLTDDEIAQLELTILHRAELSRTSG